MVLFLRSVFFTILLPGTVTVFIPYWLVSSRSNAAPSYSTLRYTGLPLIVVGAAGLLWCICDFFVAGRGTLAPVDPPRHLVVRGLYRYVRNPMYVAVVTVLLGEAVFFVSKSVLIEAAVFFVLANLFVILYEEPMLGDKFGESYADYKRTAGRCFQNGVSRDQTINSARTMIPPADLIARFTNPDSRFTICKPWPIKILTKKPSSHC